MARMVRQTLKMVRRYRWRELSLLIIPIMIVLLEMFQLLLVNLDPGTSFNINNLSLTAGLTPIIGLTVALIIFHVILNIFFRKADQILFPLVGLLSGIGVLMATRLGPDLKNQQQLGTHQLAWVLIGLVVCAGTIFALRNIHWLQRYKYTAALFGVTMFCTTLINTLKVKNLDSPTHDQLKIGSLNFQPSELLKICIVIFFAAYLSENFDVLSHGGWRIGYFKLPPLRQLGPIALMLVVGLLLFLFVRELGLALLIYGIFLSMMYLGTNKISYVLFSIGVAVILGFVGYMLFSYVRERFEVVSIDVVHWNSHSQAIYEKPNGGYQIVQGLIALSSGGVLGSGLGQGGPAFYVPIVESDMIFTALGEELGLAGLFAIIGLYLLIIHRGFRIATRATDPFSKLLAAGLTSIFAIQTLIICAGNLKLIPLTGIPLPFLSYGGSSIIANFIIVGILLRISHNAEIEKEGPF